MLNALSVKISKRRHDGEEIWEGTLSLQGARPTKLTKSKSQETSFANASAVRKAAERFAAAHNYDGVKFEEPAQSSDKISKTAKTTTGSRRQTCTAPQTTMA